MHSIILDENKPFLVIGSSGQEKELTQEIVNKYNSIAINRSTFNVDIIFRYDKPVGELYLDKCRYFVTNNAYRDCYNSNKCKFFIGEYKIISKELTTLGCYKYTITAVLNYISIVRPKAEVYLVGIDHNKKGYNDSSVKRFIEKYNDLLTIYQTDFNSKGWNLKYRDLK